MSAILPRATLPRAARWYIGSVVGAGSTVVLFSAVEIYNRPPATEWLVLAALTFLTGSFTIKLPALSARLSVSDAFVFASVLLFGPAATTVVVALDCLVATLWLQPQQRSFLRSIFNLAAASLSIWTAAQAFYAVVSIRAGEPIALTDLLWPLLLLATVYFLLNTSLIAVAVSFERQIRPFKLWIENFAWLSLNYLGGVSVAALLVSNARSIDATTISIILPLLAISYLTYRTSTVRVAEAQAHVAQVQELYMSTIETLAMAVDAKDQITHGHIRRVQVYAIELAKRLGVTEGAQLRAIGAAALLHDMGKLAIPEHILNKPGHLTTAEFGRMKQHAALGADLLSSIRFPYPVVPIVRHHHENWDGSGYPSGIAGTDIPMGARILSVVDCFDALTSDRPYRPRLTSEEAFDIIRQRRGTMYDPLVVDVFIREYANIAPTAIGAGKEARTIFASESETSTKSQAALLKQIRDTATESTLLRECRRNFSTAQSVEELCTIGAQCLRQLVPATVFAFYRYVAETDTLVCDVAVGDSNNLLAAFSIRAGQRITGWSAATRRTSMNSHAVLDLTQIAHSFSPPLRAALSVPVVHEDKLLGVLTSYSTQEAPFGEPHSYIAEQVAVAVSERLRALSSSPASTVVLPFSIRS